MLKRLRHGRAQHNLLRALEQRDTDRLRKAIKGGANPNQSIEGPAGLQLPLLIALDSNQPDAVGLLLEAGAATATLEEPLLCRAIERLEQPLPMLTQLLQLGVKQQCNTALFSCLTQHDEAQAQLLISRLLEYGADGNALNDQEQSLLECALIRDWMTLSTTLISSGAKLPPNLDQLPCSDTLKALARRTADDMAIRAQLQQH